MTIASACGVDSPDPKHRILKSVFGFDVFRPGQETVIDALLEGRHVLTVMPTGSGKSLCFQVPALLRRLPERSSTLARSRANGN
ncbi:MAG TPA: DEAD/DEAH box helicase [Rhizomicrobium sp.]|jgi:superfamily II DNA helicase RecQ|nr:DEAD/DEAH box helicase [Rhizomicrobium sp.]